MLKTIQWFMEKLIERIIPLVATSVSSTIQTVHALGQAEQQNELEEAARRYEQEGKLEIARSLRERAAQLTSTNSASEGVEILNDVTADNRLSITDQSDRRQGHARIASLDPAPVKATKKKSSRTSPANNNNTAFPDPNSSSDTDQA